MSIRYCRLTQHLMQSCARSSISSRKNIYAIDKRTWIEHVDSAGSLKLYEIYLPFIGIAT